MNQQKLSINSQMPNETLYNLGDYALGTLRLSLQQY